MKTPLRGNAIRTTWGLMLLLVGCTEAHALPADDAGMCIDPHPDCVTFTLPSDALIPWVYPYGCDAPNLERYADGVWITHVGGPCGRGGTCSDSARCEGER